MSARQIIIDDAAAMMQTAAIENDQQVARCAEFCAGWEARRANLSYDPSWSESKRSGWNAGQRDDAEESEFFAMADYA